MLCDRAARYFAPTELGIGHFWVGLRVPASGRLSPHRGGVKLGPGTKDVGSDGVGRPSRVSGEQPFKYRQVLAHGGNHVGFIKARLFLSENPQLEKFDRLVTC